VLEDWLGTIDLVCFAKHFDHLNDLIKDDEAVLVTGSVLPEENGPPKISVLDIVPLKNAFVKFPLLVSVRVPVEPGKRNGDSRAAKLRDLFERKKGDTEVHLIVEKRREFTVTVSTDLRVKPDREFKAEVAQLCGEDAYQVISGGF
jgi:DNA polymerase III alpha subunit